MTTVSKKSYLFVWLALLGFLALTWGLAEINLGPFNNRYCFWILDRLVQLVGHDAGIVQTVKVIVG